MHYEGELAVVLGRSGRKIRQGDAMDYVKGYTIANDVTVRDFVQNFYRPPVKAKGFDTFGPLGPWMVTADAFGDPTNIDGPHLRQRRVAAARQHALSSSTPSPRSSSTSPSS